MLKNCEGVLIMEIKQNIGILNALIRITCGLTILAWSTAKMVKRPWRSTFLITAILGAMKVGEGIVRYCPVTSLIQEGMKMVPDKKEDDEDSFQETIVPYNPT